MLFETIRSLICPFDTIEQSVPKQGKILDVGCGHGIFSALLAKKSSRRSVLGIDPSEYKIQLAQKYCDLSPNLKFINTDLKKLKNKKFDAIVIIDVLYLLPQKVKISLLKRVKSLLKENGCLILKTTNTKPTLFYLLVKFEEYLMINIFHYTYSMDHKLHFLTRNEYLKLLKNVGFKVQTEKTFRGTLPYFHLLFVAIKSKAKLH